MVVGYVFGFFRLFFGPSTEAQFIRDLSVELSALSLALALGVPFALRANRKWQAERDRERRVLLLRRLKRVFESNVSHLRDQFKEMQHDITSLPSFGLDLGVLEFSQGERHELLTDADLMDVIDGVHFELRHVNDRLSTIMSRSLSSPTGAVGAVYVNALLASLKEFHETVRFAAQLERDRNTAGTFQIQNVSFDVLNLKMGQIGLSVGLTPIGQPKPNGLDGGAVSHCRRAISAIEAALAMPDSGR